MLAAGAALGVAYLGEARFGLLALGLADEEGAGTYILGFVELVVCHGINY